MAYMSKESELAREIRELKDEIRQLRESQWMRTPPVQPIYVPHVPYVPPPQHYPLSPWTVWCGTSTQGAIDNSNC